MAPASHDPCRGGRPVKRGAIVPCAQRRPTVLGLERLLVVRLGNPRPSVPETLQRQLGGVAAVTERHDLVSCAIKMARPGLDQGQRGFRLLRAASDSGLLAFARLELTKRRTGRASAPAGRNAPR